MERTIYREIPATGLVWILAGVLAALVIIALVAVAYVEHYGHIVTGMNNRIVWGMPHVFAIFLILAASGALNVASVASVFSQSAYKPMARLSALLAVCLLLGGLSVLTLDLGRPDRLIVAMTTYNFASIFAWNIFLYTGFMVIVAAYLFVQMARGIPGHAVTAMGWIAFLWRLALTTGTGCIFGWLVARPGYDAAIMAPMFIAMSLAFGLAIFILVANLLCLLSSRDLGERMLARLGRLLAIFTAAILYFTTVWHLTNLYAAEHSGYENFILVNGGGLTWMFWLGHVVIGGLLPIAILLHPKLRQIRQAPLVASGLVILGGMAQVYVVVVGGQAYPMEIFPGYEVVSSIGDGAVASYRPSLPEIALGFGGVAIALLATGLGAKILRILPTSLSDTNLNM